ncbi:MAG: phosphoribosylformylglycinamidine cyclo-ligase, partial [Clostridia bacterium]|nr:phosphoribosylformylglycinamidine cyclo-ligase [Clostridia bacterium]
DYIACGKNVPEKIAAIVSGVAEGCVQSGAALIGGETAEMPGFYPENEYDLAGYCTGIVDKQAILDVSRMRKGDAVLALPSSGVHSNGFSLVRKIFNVEHTDLGKPYAELEGKTLGETLLTPTKIYVKPVLEILKNCDVRGISHITGGGFYENIPRSIPSGLGARIDKSSVRVLPVFRMLQAYGKISEHDMFNTFNMGVGMSVILKKEDADRAAEICRAHGLDAYVMGEIAEQEEAITIC